MMRLLAFTLCCLLALPALAQTRTPGPSEPLLAAFDREAALDRIFTEMKASRNFEDAKRISQRLYTVFMLAPDADAADLMNRGLRAANAFDFAEAVTVFDELVTLYPDWPEGWNQRAFAHFRARNVGAAIVDCEKTIELEPRHIGCLTGLAILHIRFTRRYKAGRAVLKEALALNPHAHERKLLEEIPAGE